MRDFFTEETANIRGVISRDPGYSELSDEQLKEKIEKTLEQRIRQCATEDTELAGYYSSLSFRSRKSLADTVFESIRGLGILGKIIADKSITEVMINGYDCIFVERAGKLTRLPDKFESQERLRNIITKFVQDMGRSVNESNPIVDTRLADGSRVNVVLDPIALNGPIVTIRRFPEEGMTIQKLIAFGSITPEAALFLQNLVKARYNIFISGGTGSGKTTFLNALSNYIPSTERVITIEDSAELQIRNVPNLVRLETRNANSAGTGGISMKELIKSALRMRPDRIVVGEVRGAEALDMLQAMNTGHDGSLSTGHANSANDMLSRLETMVLSGAEALPLEAIRQQIASAVDIIVHLSRLRDSSRKTMEITEIVGLENGKIIMNPLYVFEEDENTSIRRVSGGLKRTANKMAHPDKFINSGIYDYLEEANQ
ncbi:MAG: CpaF family protein [Lachnospiraceae bacterium]|nr:CpaF family protein [Lachnospiraceae bacterium]